jgi:hypothetical protein
MFWDETQANLIYNVSSRYQTMTREERIIAFMCAVELVICRLSVIVICSYGL